MTDNEIIKALECCKCADADCWACEFLDSCKFTVQEIMQNSIDLVNRQKAELDDLKRDDLPRCKDALRRANEIGIDLEKENKELKAEVEKLELLNAILLESCNGYSKACDTYKAEIERLQNDLAQTEDAYKTVHEMNGAYARKIDFAKAEAIKDFAYRLKQIPKKSVSKREIDDMVKEMVGE